MTTPAQERAIYAVAESLGWDKQETPALGLMLWALFRYYAWRAGSAAQAMTRAAWEERMRG